MYTSPVAGDWSHGKIRVSLVYSVKYIVCQEKNRTTLTKHTLKSLKVLQVKSYAGLEIATNTVANATNFFPLATKIVG